MRSTSPPLVTVGRVKRIAVNLKSLLLLISHQDEARTSVLASVSLRRPSTTGRP